MTPSHSPTNVGVSALCRRWLVGGIGSGFQIDFGFALFLIGCQTHRSPPSLSPAREFLRCGGRPALSQEGASQFHGFIVWSHESCSIEPRLVVAAVAIAQTAAWINIFNLLPIWQLDGSRGFRALSRAQRWAAVASLGVTWLICGDGVVAMVALFAIVEALGEAPEEGDAIAFRQYATLCIGLGLLMVLPNWFNEDLP